MANNENYTEADRIKDRALCQRYLEGFVRVMGTRTKPGSPVSKAEFNAASARLAR